MKILFNGEMKEAQPVSFVPFKEPWAEYHLDDGTVIRFRSTISGVFLLQEKDANGQPMYVSQSQNQMSVEPKP
jgi:hypothetical protein